MRRKYPGSPPGYTMGGGSGVDFTICMFSWVSLQVKTLILLASAFWPFLYNHKLNLILFFIKTFFSFFES